MGPDRFGMARGYITGTTAGASPQRRFWSGRRGGATGRDHCI